MSAAAGGNGAGPGRPVRCTGCGEIMPLAKTFPQIVEGKPTGQHVHVNADNSGTCGPIVLELLYHVVLFVTLDGGVKILRRLLPTLEPPEENYERTIDLWEAVVARQFRKTDAHGAVLIGGAGDHPRPVVTDWKAVGVRVP